MLKRTMFQLALAVGLLCAAQTARADNFTFNQNNFSQPGSLGTATTTLVAGTIQVSVTINPLYVIHNAGVGFNVAAGFTGITITAINSSPPFSADLTSHQFDGFGSFAFSLVSSESAAQARAAGTHTVTFTVSSVEGFTDAGQVNAFAAQLAPLDPNNPNTGFAATGPEPRGGGETPELASILLLGTGLAGLGGLARRRRTAT